MPPPSSSWLPRRREFDGLMGHAEGDEGLDRLVP
jgi:hypothetical protein